VPIQAVAIGHEPSDQIFRLFHSIILDVENWSSLELRSQGFVPHCFVGIKKWPIYPCVVNGNPRQPLNQLLEADLLYVRNFADPSGLSDDQLRHLTLIAHVCYKSFDLATRCVMVLEQRGALPRGAQQRYVDLLSSGNGS
jgi:hypothetical protein